MINENFEHFSETETKNFSQSTGVPFFYLKVLRLKMHYFHTKLPYQKPMLRQIEWSLQNGPITENRVLPVTALFF